MSDRHPCACDRCEECPSTAYANGDPCPSCRDGYHRPPKAVRAHLARGLVRWAELMPVATGSSGLTDKQLARAAEAWQQEHDAKPCPVPA